MIDIRFTNECVAELQAEMAVLLRGTSIVTGNVGQVVTGPAESNAAPANKRMTAAEKKAAEKAAQEAATGTGQSISTGAKRSDPAVDKQDAADEAADTAATKAVDLTHDDVKKMLGGYVQAYGMAAAQEDGTGFIGAPKISEIPNTQTALAAAIIGIAQAIEKNPKKRDIAGDGLSAEKTAELKPIVAAAIAVK